MRWKMPYQQLVWGKICVTSMQMNFMCGIWKEWMKCSGCEIQNEICWSKLVDGRGWNEVDENMDLNMDDEMNESCGWKNRMKKVAAILFCASIIYLIHKLYIHFIRSSSIFVKLFIQKCHHEIATFSSKLILYRLDITFPSTSLHVPGQGKMDYFTLREWSHKKGKWICLIYPHTGAKSRAIWGNLS